MTVTTTSPTDTPVGPYAAAAFTYHRAGWAALPLPAGQKAPVPTGWTGARGATPSGADIQEWVEHHTSGNIAIRLPPHVIGIDCDHYDGKPGGLVLDQLQAQLGALPPTWRVTSRDDGVSGIRLYRIPEGLRWPGGLGPGIDTIRFDHRYAVVWPSLHPKGGTYRWYTPDGVVTAHDVPTPDDLPDLPDAWVQHFTGGELSADQPHAGLDRDATTAWIHAHTSGPGRTCRRIDDALTRGLTDLAATHDGGRHDAALRLTNRLAWLAGEGHHGLTPALDRARAAFLAAVGGARRPRDAESEWDRMVTGAVDIAAGAHPAHNDLDPCDDPFAGLIDRSTPWQTPTTPTTPTASSTSVPALTPPGQASPATASPTVPTSPAPATDSAPTGPDAATGTSSDALATSPGTASTATPDEADDLTELQIRRNQAAATELERVRAQRAAQRALDREERDQAVEDRVWRRLLDDDAALEYKRQTEPPAPPFDAGTLADILARPAEPPMRVDGLIPWAGSALVVAMRKTGKTTLLLNYARALITGEPFLGEFDVIPIPDDARVAFLNYEVSAAQISRWAHEAGIPDDRLYLVNLRGRRNPLAHPDDRAALAALLREQNVQAVIVDPFGRAYTGVSQNDNGEVQAFLVGLEEFVRTDVGALDLLLAAHAGWDGERTRGASALEDWGDTIITLTRDADDETKRYMKAMGRDVDVDEDELQLEDHRTLVRTGNGSRRAQKGDRDAAGLAVYVVRAARENPGCSKNQLAAAVTAMDGAPRVTQGRGDSKLKAAIAFAVKQGRMRVEKGGNGRPDRHFEDTTTATTAPPPGGGTATTTTAVYEAVVGGGAPEAPSKAPTGGGGRQTPLAGGRYVFDHKTGTTIDPTTGEVIPGRSR